MGKFKWIRHVKSNNLYRVKGRIKVKVNGEWISMIEYQNHFEKFARLENDFYGFVEVNK